MKKPTVILSLSLLLLALAVPARTQEVFDLLRKGDIPAVKAMVERSPQLVEARDAQGLTLLHYAAYGSGARTSSTSSSTKGRSSTPGSRTGRRRSISPSMSDRTEVAAPRSSGGAPRSRRGTIIERTPLLLCARERGQAATARVLIEAGADVNAADKFGSTALELAAWRGKAELVDLLLEKGAKVPTSGEQWTGALSEAAARGLTRLFRRLTDGGQDLAALGPSGETLLHSAAAGGSAEIVGLLIEKGFSPSKADRFGWTPLHYAARDGRTDAARVLIERGTPADARNLMGQTAYNVAVERKMDAVAGLLAGKGADRSDIRFPVLEGEYLGQKPPGDKPELFAPGIVSSIWGLHSTAVFSPDGSEVYWAPMMDFPGEIYSRGGLLTMKRVKGRWTPPAWAPFSGPNGNDDVPFFSADGKRLYFISRRPLPGETERGQREDLVYGQDPFRLGRAQAPRSQRQLRRQALAVLARPEGERLFRGTSPGQPRLERHLRGPSLRRRLRKARQPGRSHQHARDRRHSASSPRTGATCCSRANTTFG